MRVRQSQCIGELPSQVKERRKKGIQAKYFAIGCMLLEPPFIAMREWERVVYRGTSIAATGKCVVAAAGKVEVAKSLHLVISLLLAQLHSIAHALRASILGAGARLDGARLSRRHCWYG